MNRTPVIYFDDLKYRANVVQPCARGPLDHRAGMLGDLPAGRMPVDTHTWDALLVSLWRVLVLYIYIKSEAPDYVCGLAWESSMKSRNKRVSATSSLLLLLNSN